MTVHASQVTGVVLAGGKGRRMGGQDKGLVRLDGCPLIEYVLDALRPQVGGLMINVNRNHDIYRVYGERLVDDTLSDFQGPLAGFAASMEVAETPWILTVPCDVPLLPSDLLARLASALERQQAELAVAHDGERWQTVHALLPVSLYPSLARYLGSGERKIDRWYAKHRMARADFSDCPEAFDNINTPEQREAFAHSRQRT